MRTRPARHAPSPSCSLSTRGAPVGSPRSPHAPGACRGRRAVGRTEGWSAPAEWSTGSRSAHSLVCTEPQVTPAWVRKNGMQPRPSCWRGDGSRLAAQLPTLPRSQRQPGSGQSHYELLPVHPRQVARTVGSPTFLVAIPKFSQRFSPPTGMVQLTRIVAGRRERRAVQTPCGIARVRGHLEP